MVRIFWILCVYITEATIPAEWRKYGLPSKRQMKAWTLQSQCVLIPYLKAEWKIPFCNTVDPLLLKGLSVIRYPVSYWVSPVTPDAPTGVFLCSSLKFWHRYEYAKCNIKTHSSRTMECSFWQSFKWFPISVFPHLTEWRLQLITKHWSHFKEQILCSVRSSL